MSFQRQKGVFRNFFTGSLTDREFEIIDMTSRPKFDILITLFHPQIKQRFSLEVTMDPHLFQSLLNMKMITGHFMEISKDGEVVMDQ